MNSNSSIISEPNIQELEHKKNIITQNLHEIIGLDELTNIIATKENPVVYWGTAPTGQIHIGYLVPLMKICDLIDAGCKVIILIADVHSLLDDKKSVEKLVEYRTTYYMMIITSILESLGYDSNSVAFVRGSEYQMTPDYTKDVYRLTMLTSMKVSIHAGSAVTKNSADPIISSLLYPLLQSLDEAYLDCDIQLGGIDQRKIFGYSRQYLPKLQKMQHEGCTRNYKKRIYLLTPMVDGLRTKENDNKNKDLENPESNKMSSSDNTSKIHIIEDFKIIKNKINKVYCVEGNIQDNSLLSMTQHIIFPLLKKKGITFTINRDIKYGGPIVIDDYDSLIEKFANLQVLPVDLKLGIIDNLELIIKPIRNIFNSKNNSYENHDIIKLAYP